MTDYCGGCRFDPKIRVGDDARPFTAGYWWYLSRIAHGCKAIHA
jgi:deoxyribodipyrimidine photolyase-related protein